MYRQATYLILAFGLICLTNCGEESEPSQSSHDHLSYFGFVLTDTYWDDPTDAESKTVYLDEISAFSNLGDLLVVDPSEDISPRLAVFNREKLQAIVHVSSIFFEITSTTGPSGFNYNLRADYQERWQQFIESNTSQLSSDRIACFYLGEEPTWNGISYQELQLASDLIKKTTPDIPIMIIEAYPALSDLEIPSSVDWYGFDHYFIKSPDTDPVYLREMELLESKQSNPNQKIILVMDSHYIPEIHGGISDIQLDEMDAVANSYYNLAKSNTSVIGIVGYFWPSGFDRDNAIGARHMPNHVKQAYINMGTEITDR